MTEDRAESDFSPATDHRTPDEVAASRGPGPEGREGLGTLEFAGRRARNQRLLTALVISDFAALLAATLIATAIRFGDPFTTVRFENVDYRVAYYQLSLIVTVLWMVLLYFEGMYNPERLSWGRGEFGRVVRALSLGVVGLILIAYAIGIPGLSRGWTLIAWLLAAAFVSLGRILVHSWLRRSRERGRMLAKTLVVGTNAEGRHIGDVLAATPSTGLVPVGAISATASCGSLECSSISVPVLGTPGELRSIAERDGIDTVIIASSAFDHDVLARMVADLRGSGVGVHVSSGLFEVLTSRVFVRDLAGVPMITLTSVAFTPTQRAVKRGFDLVVAGLIIVLGSPLWLGIALAIKLTSRGPVFYVQERIGKEGCPFGMYKFRSMVVDADSRVADLQQENEADGPLFKMKDDPRVTKVGKWLRKFSLDEFPQLINVVRGEMSLVGPRPPLPREAEDYSEYHWRRMEVLPGMTGLWQVSGRSELSFDEMVRLDLYYIENWSVGFDTSIIVRTVPAVVFSRGAY